MNPKGMRKWNLDPNPNPGTYDVKPEEAGCPWKMDLHVPSLHMAWLKKYCIE